MTNTVKLLKIKARENNIKRIWRKLTHICRLTIIIITTVIIRDNSNEIKKQENICKLSKKSLYRILYSVTISFNLEDKIYTFSDKKAERMNDRTLFTLKKNDTIWKPNRKEQEFIKGKKSTKNGNLWINIVFLFIL